MSSHWLPPLEPIVSPRTGAWLGVAKQLDLLRWRLDMPFTLPSLSHALAGIIPPRHEHHAGTLAEAVIRDWLKRGAIKSTRPVGGLPAYGVAR